MMMSPGNSIKNADKIVLRSDREKLILKLNNYIGIVITASLKL